MNRRPSTVVPTTRSIGAAPARTSSSTPSRSSTAIPVGCSSSPAPTGPGSGARSSTSTAWPARANSAAAASPAVPAPTIPIFISDTQKLPSHRKSSHVLQPERGRADRSSMTSIRNLPLAVRLGAPSARSACPGDRAFKAETIQLAEHDLRAAELLGGLQSAPRTTWRYLAGTSTCRRRRRRQDSDRGRDRGQLGEEQGGRSGAGEAVRRHCPSPASTPTSPRSAPSSSRPRSRRSLPPRRGRRPRSIFAELVKSDTELERSGDSLLEAANQLAADRRRRCARQRGLRNPHHHPHRADRRCARRRPWRCGSPARSCARSRRSASA